MTLTDEELSEFRNILESLSIRRPNPSPSDQQKVTLKEGIEQRILQQSFRLQYHKDNNVVEFIPKYIRPMIDHPWKFYKSEARPTERDPKEKKTEPVQTEGFEHEKLVQEKFESLGSSPLFSENRITIFHNMKNDFIRYNKLKKFMNNEFDLVVFDALHGVFVVETKKREHANFKEKSLKKELAKQQKRVDFLCAIKNFLGVESPITSVISTKLSLTGNDNHILDKHDSNSYVLGVNFADNFDKTWKLFLDDLTLPTATVSPDDIEKFAVTLNTLLYFKDTPSHLHKNLTGGSVTTPGNYQLTKKNVIWIQTKQQLQIIHLIEDTLSKNAREFAGGSCQTTLKLLIPGCFGSGKTLMLHEAAKVFCRENTLVKSVANDARRVAFVIYDLKGDMSLLLEQLKASFEDEELTKGRVSVVNLTGYDETAISSTATGDTRRIFVSKTVDESHSARLLIGCKTITNICCWVGYIQSLGTVDLILIDEFRLFNKLFSNNKSLFCKNHSMTYMIFTTIDNTDKDNLYKEKFKDFETLQLNGNLRSCPSICDYVSQNRQQSSTEEKGSTPRVQVNNVFKDSETLQPNRNLRSNPSICDYVSQNRRESSTGEVSSTPLQVAVSHNVTGGSVDPVIKLKDNPDLTDLAQVIEKIESLLETEKKENIYVIINQSGTNITNHLIPELKRLGVEFGNFRKFTGCEAATVIYIGRNMRDYDRDQGLSRATVNLIVFYCG